MSIRLLIIYIICISYCHQAVATQRALIFGLGQQEDASWGKIHGDKDVELVSGMLTQAGFTDIRIVTNEQATKLGMEAAFLGLIGRCEPGDVVYIHYSGHGQLMTDLDGDEAKRQNGRHAQWDEAWIPYDAYMNYGSEDRGDKHFCDDEVSVYLQYIRQKVGQKGEIYVVIDACHSGDATRGEDEECVRGVDTKFMIPMGKKPQEATAIEEQWLTISACKPYQLCFEMKEPRVGKLTYALYSLGAQMFKMSNMELQQWLQEYIEAHPARVRQEPVVSGQK